MTASERIELLQLELADELAADLEERLPVRARKRLAELRLKARVAVEAVSS